MFNYPTLLGAQSKEQCDYMCSIWSLTFSLIHHTVINCVLMNRMHHSHYMPMLVCAHMHRKCPVFAAPLLESHQRAPAWDSVVVLNIWAWALSSSGLLAAPFCTPTMGLLLCKKLQRWHFRQRQSKMRVLTSVSGGQFIKRTGATIRLRYLIVLAPTEIVQLLDGLTQNDVQIFVLSRRLFL